MKKPSLIRGFAFAYLSTAIIIFLLISMSQAFLQFGLIPQEIQARNQATLIGRQRGHVLQMTGDVLGLTLYPAYRERLLADLQAQDQIWEQVQQASIQGNSQLGINPSSFPGDVQAKVASTQGDYTALREIIHQILAHPPTTTQAGEAYLRAMLLHTAAYTQTFQTIFTELSDNADQRVSTLQRLELFLYCFSVLILLAEGLFVVRPVLKQLAQVFQSIQEIARQVTKQPAPPTPTPLEHP